MTLPIDASLRQFSRAVFADRLAGDEFARAVLAEMDWKGGVLFELAAERGAAFASRTHAFRTFIEKWKAAFESPSSGLFTDRALIEAMGPPPTEERLTLILADILGFSLGEVEKILAPMSRPIDEVLTSARAAIEGERESTAVIVEDEPLIAADLAELLEGLHVNVVGSARTAEAGAAIALEKKPDILLADYNLDGAGTGVDAVMQIQESHDCPVVFITGYPDKVLSGDDVEPDFVIVKPYRPEAVRAAVAHCLETPRMEMTQ